MEKVPRNWHELSAGNDFGFDLSFRRLLIESGVYFLPLAVKQCSISAAHTEKDIDFTLEEVAKALKTLRKNVA
jgi:glutamate-1-semialdehyde 2,1-aminomutase